MTFKRNYSLCIIIILLLSMVSCKANIAIQDVFQEEPTLATTKISYIFPTPTSGTEEFPPSVTFTQVLTEPVSLTPSPSMSNPEMGPTSTPNPSEVRTGSPARTQTPTITLSPNPTPTWPVGWSGEWTVYYGEISETMKSGNMTITINGTTINAVAVFDGESFTLTGDLSADRQKVNGTYIQNSNTGAFYWELITIPQFGGNLDNEFAFCAARPNSTKPPVCGIFFPS